MVLCQNGHLTPQVLFFFVEFFLVQPFDFGLFVFLNAPAGAKLH